MNIKEYNDDIFVDDTFFITPKFSYQIFITRTYAKELDRFYTTSFAQQKQYFLIQILNIAFGIIKESLEIKKKINYAIMKAINKANEISVLIERYKNIEQSVIDGIKTRGYKVKADYVIPIMDNWFGEVKRKVEEEETSQYLYQQVVRQVKVKKQPLIDKLMILRFLETPQSPQKYGTVDEVEPCLKKYCQLIIFVPYH
ncbi:hypothetical protein H8356DRAFT_1340632 [Neocallimastix lanati (nom. inval.)]|nr:hypothetical protein H8356DRAFT_1340632 [Neocallimastix sp. JGI-2020a]